MEDNARALWICLGALDTKPQPELWFCQSCLHCSLTLVHKDLVTEHEEEKGDRSISWVCDGYFGELSSASQHIVIRGLSSSPSKAVLVSVTKHVASGRHANSNHFFQVSLLPRKRVKPVLQSPSNRATFYSHVNTLQTNTCGGEESQVTCSLYEGFIPLCFYVDIWAQNVT